MNIQAEEAVLCFELNYLRDPYYSGPWRLPREEQELALTPTTLTALTLGKKASNLDLLFACEPDLPASPPRFPSGMLADEKNATS